VAGTLQSDERLSIPAGTNWVTFTHFNHQAANTVLDIMNTASIDMWRAGDTVTIIRNGIPTQAVSYTRQTSSWRDIASFVLEMHKTSNVYILKTSNGVDLTNAAPPTLQQDLRIAAGKSYMGWHGFPMLSVKNILEKTPVFSPGDRFQVKLSTSTAFSVVFSKVGLAAGVWTSQDNLNQLQHVRNNVYSFQIVGMRSKILFFPFNAAQSTRRHRLDHQTDHQTSRQLLQSSRLPDRSYYTNQFDCITSPQCRCRSVSSNININWPGQVCNACVMMGNSVDNCIGNDAYSHQQVQVGFYLNTSNLDGVDVSANTLAVAKLKKTTTTNGAPFPEMSIRQWGHPVCVGCHKTNRTTNRTSLEWVSPTNPNVCVSCEESDSVFFFRLALMTLNSEIRKINEIASKRALLINFEFESAR